MNAKQAEAVGKVLGKHECVKLAYLFGSRARGKAGPTSDYDIAVYFDGLTESEMADRLLTIASELQEALGTDAVDIVVLNTTDAPELKYDIIKHGVRIHEVEPYHVLIEPQILNEYFDFYEGLKRFGLTRATS